MKKRNHTKLTLFILVFTSWLWASQLPAQFGPPGGGSGDGYGGGDGNGGGNGALHNHIVDVSGADRTLTVTWEFEYDYPIQNQHFDPYLIAFRGGAEILRKQLNSELCTKGEHKLSVDLGPDGHFSKGQYGFVLVYFDGWQPDVLGFGKGFLADTDNGDFELVDTGLHNLVINETGWAPTSFMGCSPCQSTITPQQGWIGPGREDFTERVVLYNPITGGGCTSCGGSPISFESGIFELHLRSLWDLSSLPSLAGMGFYLDVVDSSGRVFLTNNEKLAVRMHNLPGICDVITMNQLETDGVGQLTDPNGFTKSCIVIGGSQPTDQLAAADKLEVSYFNGSKLVYECVDTPDGSADLEKDLRLIKIVDRCQRSIVIHYGHPTARKIDTLIDNHGNTYSFEFGPDIAGRATVSSITFPNGAECKFEYTDDFLTKVYTPDWHWSASVTNEPATQTVCYAIHHPTEGNKRYKLTQDFILLDQQIINQPASVCRSIETDYGRNLISMYQNPDNSNEFRVLRGDDQLSMVTLGQSEQFATDFSVGNIEDGFHAFSNIQGESFFSYRAYPHDATTKDRILGVSAAVTDTHGFSFAPEFDSDRFVVKKNYSDGSFEEMSRNNFKQITRLRDRLGRVTKYKYDSRGNLLERHEGMLDIGGNDVSQPEYAIYKWSYYPDDHQNACMLKTEFSPRNSGEQDLYRTDYVYDANNRLVKKIESADEPGGERPEWSKTYYANGLLKTANDPMGRTALYLYDDSARVIQITYNDGSTDQTYYDPDFGKPLYEKNRNDVVSRTRYLSDGKIWDVIANYGNDSDILDGTIEHKEGDVNQQTVSIHAYGTTNGQPTYSLVNGTRTEFSFDHRRRGIRTRSFVSKNVFRDQIDTYDSRNRIFYSEDHWGRRTYHGFRPSDGEMVRTIVCTHDGISFKDNESVISATRNDDINDGIVVKDAIRNAAGEIIEVFDPIGIRTLIEIDSRGRQIRKVEAVGKAVERVTENKYDTASNLIEVRHPRYFDADDARGLNKCKTNYSYNGRSLLKSQIESSETSESTTTRFTYHLDGKQSKKIDPKGNEWRTDFHNCCGRLLGSRNPLGDGTLANSDFMGQTTHTAVVGNYDEHINNSHNPIDEETYGEQTIRYDRLGRKAAETTWLAPQDSIDPNLPRIAGFDGVPRAEGYTSQILYDNNLADGIGLDSEHGVAATKLGGGTFQISLRQCLLKLKEPFELGGAATEFENGFASGSAIVSINAAYNIVVTISDGLGNTVMTASVEPFDGDGPNELITWRCNRPDFREVNLPESGKVIESVTVDAKGNTTIVRKNSVGWILSTLDQDSNVSHFRFDAKGQLKESRNANEVGYDFAYDELGRMTTKIDTYGDAMSYRYNKADQLVEKIDAKSKSSFVTYNAINQKIKTIDRVGSETTYAYDLNGNLEKVTDAEGQTTEAVFNAANQKVKTIFPDHELGSNSGDSNYGIIEYAYNPQGKLRLQTDQRGDTCATNYNLAGIITSKNYRTRKDSPDGPTSDSDLFVLDLAGRVVEATSSKYRNTISRTYDDLGRIMSESLTIGIESNERTYTSSREFDVRGQTKSIVYPDGKQVVRDYNKQGWIESVEYDGETVNSRNYDAGGRLIANNFGNGVSTTYTYRTDDAKADDFVHQIDIKNGVVPIDSFEYVYDENKNVNSETRSGVMSGFGWTTYTENSNGFDDMDRITDWSRNDNSLVRNWSFSPIGNRRTVIENESSQAYGYSEAHEVTSIASYNLQHDAKGNVIDNGHGQEYLWDFENQLCGVSTNAGEVSFAYDAFGRRVRKTTTSSDLVFVSAGNQILAEYDFDDQPSDSNANYVYATFLDEPIIKDGFLPTGIRSKIYYHCDRRFNVVAITNEIGNCVERYAYTPYGRQLIADAEGEPISTSAVNNHITYTGRTTDIETGLLYFRSRYFDPQTGSFISRDPMGYVDGMSLYNGYFAPSFLDPLGTRKVMGKTKNGSTIYWSNAFKSCVIDIPGPSGTMSQKPVQCPYRGGWKSYGKCKRNVTLLHKGKIRGGGFRNLDWSGNLDLSCTAGGNVAVSKFKNFWASINKGSYLFNFPDSIAVGAGATWGPLGLGVTRNWRGTIENEGSEIEDVSCGSYMVKGKRVKFSANLRISYDVALGIKGSTFAKELPNVEGSVGASGSFLEYHYKEYVETIAYCCKCSPKVCGVKPEDEKVWFDRIKSDRWQIHVLEDVRRQIAVKQPSSSGSGSGAMPETRW